MNEPNDKFIKIDEIVEITGIGKTKVNELIAKGKLIKPIIIEGFNNRLFSYNELQDWIEAQKQRRSKTA